MKPILALNLAVFTILASSYAMAGIIGEAQIIGNGCVEVEADKALVQIDGQAQRYSVAQHVSLAKTVSAGLERKICNFRIPVKLNQNEKLIVSDVAQWVRMSASKGTEVKISQEVFLAGSRGEPLTASIKSVGSLAYSSKTLRAPGIVAESACGRDVIVGGNLSAIATGSRRATAQSGSLNLTLAIVSCE